MPFDSGSVSFRMFQLQKEYDPRVVEKFARRAAPPIDTLGKEPIRGWVTGRHLLDREIREEKCLMGGYLHVQLMQAERKVPEALLRAYCRLEEEAEMKARGAAFLPRQVRAEIKARMLEELTPQMPPTLTGIQSVMDFRNGMLFASAMADKAIDRFTAYFRETAGETPVLMTPAMLAVSRREANVRDMLPTSFSPDGEVPPPSETDIGMEFLTWLWYYLDNETAEFELSDGANYALMLEGPASFYGALSDDPSAGGPGAMEAVFRRGLPLAGREAAMALVCGKQLRSVKFTLSRDDRLWSATVDSQFAIRSLKLPKTEQVDPVGVFQERMMAIEEFWSTLFAIFDAFVEERSDAAQWGERTKAIGEWAAKRAS